MDQFKDLSALESQSQNESSSSIQLPSIYHSTRTSFYPDSANDSFQDNDETLSSDFIPKNGNQPIMRDETEETMLDGSCDNLGKLASRNCKLVKGNFWLFLS